MASTRLFPEPCDGSRAVPISIDIINGYAWCPHCRREYAVCTDGTVRFHRLRA